jgi:hypothetical protein
LGKLCSELVVEKFRDLASRALGFRVLLSSYVWFVARWQPDNNKIKDSNTVPSHLPVSLDASMNA